MLLRVFAVASCLLAGWLFSASVPAEPGVTLSALPESLARWYKPRNKRQVWLHTMFRLRREMQAVAEYAQAGEVELMARWGGRLLRDYRSIATMVPEWEPELDMEWAGRLEQAIEDRDLATVRRGLGRLKRSCRSCHNEYRPLVAALYRSADFSAIELTTAEGGKLDYPQLMQSLSRQVNRIKIALEDQRLPMAGDALRPLAGQLDLLGESCQACHREDEGVRGRILGQSTKAVLADLERMITAGDLKQAGRQLGALAVEVCARCHGTHRTLYDLGRQIRKAVKP